MSDTRLTVAEIEAIGKSARSWGEEEHVRLCAQLIQREKDAWALTEALADMVSSFGCEVKACPVCVARYKTAFDIVKRLREGG